MSALAAALPELLRSEMAPAPGRSRHALFVGLGSTVALIAALTLQVDTFFAPLIAFQALQPHTLCSWGRMARCIWICAVSAALTVMFGSVLLQAPWLFLPCFFVAVSVVIYVIPLSSKLLEVLGILPPMARILYVGVFHPQQMGLIAGQMWAAYTIGVVSATICARVFSPEHPRDELAGALSASFALAHQRLRDAGGRFRDLSRVSSAPPAPALPALAARLQLLDRARQDGIHRDDERALMALITTTERVESAVEVATGLSYQPIGTTYRRLIDGEAAALLDALDAALVGAARSALRRVDAPAAVTVWPDVLGALHALEQRQLALRQRGAFADVSVAEGAQVNAFVAQLRNLALALRVSPDEVERFAAGDRAERAAEHVPGTALRFDAYAARFALKCGLATTVALLIPIAAGIDALFSLVVAPFLVAQTSYGATIEKAPLRLLGVGIGGAISLAIMMTLMVNTNDVTLWLAVFFVIVTGAAYFALGGPRVSYTVMQVAVTFMFVTVVAAPATDVTLALWRAFGNFLGAVIILTTFRLIAPDYAGRQLIARLRDLLGDVLGLLPTPTTPLLSIPRALALHRDIGFSVADILRLVAEARLEGSHAGIDPARAVEAAGLAQRIAYRAVAICRGRSLVDVPPLPPVLRATVDATETAVRAHLGMLHDMLAARDTMARPGSRGHRHACAAASGLAACARPDLGAALQMLMRCLDDARFDALADWPPAATGSLFGEVEHWRRIIDLLPALDAQLVHLCGADTLDEAIGAL